MDVQTRNLLMPEKNSSSYLDDLEDKNVSAKMVKNISNLNESFEEEKSRKIEESPLINKPEMSGRVSHELRQAISVDHQAKKYISFCFKEYIVNP